MATILVVDDNHAGRSLLARLLRLEGYHPLVAGNVWEAMQVLERQDVDLVVLDFNLPGLDGDVLLERLASHPRLRHLPVIMVTAQRFNEQLFARHRGHLRDWMTKGEYGADELIASIEQNLESHQGRTAIGAEK